MQSKTLPVRRPPIALGEADEDLETSTRNFDLTGQTGSFRYE